MCGRPSQHGKQAQRTLVPCSGPPREGVVGPRLPLYLELGAGKGKLPGPCTVPVLGPPMAGTLYSQ